MDQILHGSGSQTYSAYQSRNTELAETAAQLETLRLLENAILQHRQILDRSHDYMAKNDLRAPMG